MYDYTSRTKKALRIIKVLAHYFGEKRLRSLRVLDIGSSTGIIAATLASHFKQVIGVDIDRSAIAYARKNFKKRNLEFHYGDAMNLSFPKNFFDVVICAQVYEHVPNPKKLFSEVYRVLKPSGICYLAALNKLWPIEPHYNLLFLSWIPKQLANIYVTLLGKAQRYYETPLTYWELKRLVGRFTVVEYTHHILTDPQQFGYDDMLPHGSVRGLIARILTPLARYLTPTFFWLLMKKN